jgi:hypothetical protein
MGNTGSVVAANRSSTTMEPMKPMKGFSISRWWPPELGEASSSGSSSDMRYAYFSQARRLLIEQQGQLTIYDTGAYQFRGAFQPNGAERKLSFVSQRGLVALDSLKVVSPSKP